MTQPSNATKSGKEAKSFGESVSTGFDDFYHSDQFFPVMAIVGLMAGLIVAYGNTFIELMDDWDNPQYSHGYVIPVLALVLIVLRREVIRPASPVARWSGVGLLAAGLGLRLAASYIGYPYFDKLSFLPCAAGVFLLVGGWQIMRWAGPAIAFLFFMYPLPGPVNRTVLYKLNSIATAASTYGLETLGIGVYRSGNRINLGHMEMGVVDACSGLRMATIFFALAVMVVLVAKRSWWENLIIVASAVPIAVLVNVIRITVTGVMYKTTSKELADVVFHDLAGWVMMPLALGFLFIELQILANLFIEEEPTRPQAMGIGGLQPGLKLKGSGR